MIIVITTLRLYTKLLLLIFCTQQLVNWITISVSFVHTFTNAHHARREAFPLYLH